MFKKTISCILVLLMMLTSVCSAMNPGDVIGNYYYTDIKTYLRGELLDSYNIGGTTVILCEAMSNYGFVVGWDAAARKLNITDMKGKAASNATGAAEGVIGDIAGEYYYTDIVTTVNGDSIESYNIGGQTVIPATALRNLGYDVIWEENERRVLIDTEPGTVISGSDEITDVTIKENQTYHGTMTLRKNAITFNGLQIISSNDYLIETTIDKKIYVPFQPIAESLGISYKWDSATATLTVDVPNDDIIKPANSQQKNSIKSYGAMEYETKDIVLNVVNEKDTFNNVDAMIYGTDILVETQDLADCLNFYCFNEIDFYTETMVYYLYSGMYINTGSNNNNNNLNNTPGYNY